MCVRRSMTIHSSRHFAAQPNLYNAYWVHIGKCHGRLSSAHDIKQNYSSAAITMPRRVTITRAFWPTLRPAASSQSPHSRR